MTQVPLADQQLTVIDPDTGRPVALTVREFRHREALTLTALARPLIADLAALTVEGESTSLPDALAIEGVMAAHTRSVAGAHRPRLRPRRRLARAPERH